MHDVLSSGLWNRWAKARLLLHGTGCVAVPLRNSMMRILSILTVIAGVSACAPPALDVSDTATMSATPPAEARIVVPPTNALPSATTSPVVIRGCCTFTVPAGATVSAPSGVPIDGFRQYEVTLNGETVRVEPFLGSYGWLNAEGGADLRLDGRLARETRTEEGVLMVVPLRATVDGREALMSLRVRSNCSTGDCFLYRAITQSIAIEARWSPQQQR